MTPQERKERHKGIQKLADTFLENNFIDPEISEKLGVKRGLRNPNGTGVLAGLTNICDVVGYDLVDGQKIPAPGKLIYRGIDVADIVEAAAAEDRLVFEEVAWLLLFGSLPTKTQLKTFREIMGEYRALPENFVEDIIIKSPSPNIMNKMATSVLALYPYDENPEDVGLENLIEQSIRIIAGLSTIMVNAYQIKSRVYDKSSMHFHVPTAELSIAEHILATYRADQKYTKEEAALLDLCLVLQADHGGGNNSTFACRVLSSSGTDTYAAISAAIGSLKGPKHGGANIQAIRMLEYIKAGVRDYSDLTEVKEFVRKIMRKQEGDGTGLVYGIGHAVYTASDPRAVMLRTAAKNLAYEKGYAEDFELLYAVEQTAPEVFAEEKGMQGVCANLDLYSGLIYKILGFSEDLFTPLFAISRVPGWCAHRLEEVVFANRIIRPAYKYLGVMQKYIPLEERI